MKIRYKANLCAGIFSLILSLAACLLIPKQIGPDFGGASYGITSRTIPYAVAVLFAGSGIGLMIQSLVLKKDYIRELNLKKESKALGYMLVLAVYAWIFPWGFILSTAFLGIATLAFTGTRKKLYYGIILVAVVALYLIFTQLLHVRLP